MALIKCKECGKEISDQAKTCPNCGIKIEIANIKKNNIIVLISVIIVIIIFLLSIYFLYMSNPINKYKYEAINILKNYKEHKNSITIKELSQQLEDLQYDFNKQYKNIDNLSYSIFSNGLGIISSNIKNEGYYNDTLNNTKIDEYIKELQEYR